jgi:hypothetical protein
MSLTLTFDSPNRLYKILVRSMTNQEIAKNLIRISQKSVDKDDDEFLRAVAEMSEYRRKVILNQVERIKRVLL